jgi:hypothetical protein
VKGLGTTAVPRANIGTRSDQHLHDLLPVGGGCDVQGGLEFAGAWFYSRFWYVTGVTVRRFWHNALDMPDLCAQSCSLR